MNRARSDRGATAIAYAVMVAIIALMLVAGVWVLGDQIEATLSGGAECVASPGECEGGAGGGGGGGGGGGDASTTVTTNPPTTSPPTTSGATTTTSGS